MTVIWGQTHPFPPPVVFTGPLGLDGPRDPFADENPAEPPAAADEDAERDIAAEEEEAQIERHEAEEPD